MAGYFEFNLSHLLELMHPIQQHKLGFQAKDLFQPLISKNFVNSKYWKYITFVLKNIVKYKPLEDILELYEEHNALDAPNVALPHQNDQLQD